MIPPPRWKTGGCSLNVGPECARSLNRLGRPAHRIDGASERKVLFGDAAHVVRAEREFHQGIPDVDIRMMVRLFRHRADAGYEIKRFGKSLELEFAAKRAAGKRPP